MGDQDFETVLTRYQQNLTDYKVTGSMALGTIVNRDKTWLDSYVASLEQQSQNQQTFIQRFMEEYETTNPDLIELQNKLKEIREKGPKIQDAYETEKKASEEEPIDFTPYYVKAGLIVGIVSVVALVSFFRPVYTI